MRKKFRAVLSTQYSVLAAATAAGLVLRLADLGRESFWLDEAGRAAIAALPLATIPGAVGVVELSPPLYHLLLHTWQRLVGADDVALRLLSALLSAAAIPATYALGRELVGRRAARVAALLAAATPLYVAYAQDAAMYALFLLLALLATLGYVRLVRDGLRGRGALLLYAVSMLLALYTHYYALFLLAAQSAYVLWLASTRALPPGLSRAWVLAQVGLGLAFAPWLPLLWQQAGLAASVGDWAVPDPLAALGGLVLALSVGPATGLPAGLVALLFLPALAAGVAALRHRRNVLALLACYALVPVALGLLAAYPLHAFRERGFIAIAFVPQLLVAAGLVRGWSGCQSHGRNASDSQARTCFVPPTPAISGKGTVAHRPPPSRPVARLGRPLRVLYGAGLLALLLHGTAAELAEPKEDWRAAATLISLLGREGDAVYLMHYGSQFALDRYLPPGLPRRGLPADFDWRQGYTARYWLEPADLEMRLAPDLAQRRRAWVVLSHADGRGDQLLLDYLDARYPAVLRQDFHGIRLRLWALQPGS
jgi:hypothetical protein